LLNVIANSAEQEWVLVFVWEMVFRGLALYSNNSFIWSRNCRSSLLQLLSHKYCFQLFIVWLITVPLLLLQ